MPSQQRKRRSIEATGLINRLRLKKKKTVGATPKADHATKTTKTPQRPLRSLRAASNTETLACRYCGSDDLAPSFKKRRDARCRACFKKRYGSIPKDKKNARTQKTKAAK